MHKTNISKITSASLIAAMALSVYGCSSTETEAPVNIGGQTEVSVETSAEGQGQQTSDNYTFVYTDSSILVNQDVTEVLAQLGDGYKYYESESCAYQGKDKIYTYPFFVIYTYPLDGKDFISSIELKADTVQTQEGIKIGSSKDDVIAAYGDGYEDAGTVIKYTKGITVLSFVIKDGEVTSIVYDYKDLKTA